MLIMKRMLLLGSLLLLLAGCINIPIGEGNKVKIGKDGISLVDKEDTEHTFEIDEENDSFNFETTNKDGDTQGFTLGGGEDGEMRLDILGDDEEYGVVRGDRLDLPFEMPEDIPIDTEANIKQHMKADHHTSVYYETPTHIDEVIDMYESYLDNKTLDEEPSVTDMSFDDATYKTYKAVSGDYYITLSIHSGDQDEVASVVNIIVNTYAEDEEYE